MLSPKDGFWPWCLLTPKNTLLNIQLQETLFFFLVNNSIWKIHATTCLFSDANNLAIPCAKLYFLNFKSTLDWQVDQPSCSTPRKREFNFPSVSSIEELRTPSFEELLNSFWDSKSSIQVNGDIKHILDAAHSLGDPRAPLTALN